MLIAAIIVGLLVVAVVLLYNRLVRLRVRADHAWAQVDAQLQRRHDLVPALVATVSGYAVHERDTIEAVTAARVAALQVTDPRRRADVEDEFSRAIGQLIAVSESYPQLQADGNFRALSSELSDTEDRIAFSRDFANDRVARYREAIRSFPGLLVARPFGFEDRPMFDADPDGRRAHVIDPEDLR